MSVRDFVMLALGEITLALAFGVGVAVGIALTRKESRHDHSDEEATRN